MISDKEKEFVRMEAETNNVWASLVDDYIKEPKAYAVLLQYAMIILSKEGHVSVIRMLAALGMKLELANIEEKLRKENEGDLIMASTIDPSSPMYYDHGGIHNEGFMDDSDWVKKYGWDVNKVEPGNPAPGITCGYNQATNTIEIDYGFNKTKEPASVTHKRGYFFNEDDLTYVGKDLKEEKKGNIMKKLIRNFMMASVIWTVFCICKAANPLVAILADHIEWTRFDTWAVIAFGILIGTAILCILVAIWKNIYSYIWD